MSCFCLANMKFSFQENSRHSWRGLEKCLLKFEYQTQTFSYDHYVGASLDVGGDGNRQEVESETCRFTRVL